MDLVTTQRSLPVQILLRMDEIGNWTNWVTGRGVLALRGIDLLLARSACVEQHRNTRENVLHDPVASIVK
jgi:hypothetical protein